VNESNFKIKYYSREKKSGPYFAKPTLDEDGDNRESYKMSFADALAGHSGGDSRSDAAPERP
jgi:hypothetical protein